MTRFVYLCDTHLGCQETGYRQLPRHPDRLTDIIEAVTDWMEAEGNIDFVLHGGDMVNDGTREQIHEAAHIFRFPVPIYLCLGNHDLAQPESLSHWLDEDGGGRFFPGGRPDFLIETGDCVIHVLPNQWCSIPFYWEGTQNSHLLPEQQAAFARQYQANRGRVQILLTHSPVFGLPPEQTGKKEPFEAPCEEFAESMLNLVRDCPDLLCVLGAHNHLNMRIQHEGVHFVTGSSLIELPIAFKVFECDGESLKMKTVSLGDRLGLSLCENHEKAFVQGDASVRTFHSRRKGA